VFLRIAITLGKGGGVFKTLRGLTRVGLGGRHGKGQQFISWIHEQDLCRIMAFAIENEKISGVYNAAAPKPERNVVFMQLLRKKTGAWLGLPQPVWLLNIGTRLMGTEKELVLKSRNVVPDRLLKAGFVFRFNTVEEAMNDLLKSNTG
jgi:NAD dependent epimerase/dehydratase family enzyme